MGQKRFSHPRGRTGFTRPGARSNQWVEPDQQTVSFHTLINSYIRSGRCHREITDNQQKLLVCFTRPMKALGRSSNVLWHLQLEQAALFSTEGGDGAEAGVRLSFGWAIPWCSRTGGSHSRPAGRSLIKAGNRNAGGSELAASRITAERYRISGTEVLYAQVRHWTCFGRRQTYSDAFGN